MKTRRGRGPQANFVNINERKLDEKFGRFFVGEYRYSNRLNTTRMKERERKVIKNSSLKHMYDELMATTIKLKKIIKRNSTLETEIDIMKES